jgi:hypothetical protein
MIPLKDCEWGVYIFNEFNGQYFWYIQAKNPKEAGTELIRMAKGQYGFHLRKDAEDNFKQFAKLNEIENYKFNN